ncbi:MAG: hypothetical protein PUP90_03470 [Nostoc sp. S4]|nr:hypothetical protein [Nostoc sp. S4]
MQGSLFDISKDLTQPLDIKSEQIRVRSLTFSLDDNLDRAGQTFLKNLFLLIALRIHTNN